MNLEQLREECLKIKGIEKVRKARLKDGIFIIYKPVMLSSGMFHRFTDFIHLDTWQDSLKRTKAEYERFFIKTNPKNESYKDFAKYINGYIKRSDNLRDLHRKFEIHYERIKLYKEPFRKELQEICDRAVTEFGMAKISVLLSDTYKIKNMVSFYYDEELTTGNNITIHYIYSPYHIRYIESGLPADMRIAGRGSIIEALIKGLACCLALHKYKNRYEMFYQIAKDEIEEFING